jgi:hypothetical protein
LLGKENSSKLKNCTLRVVGWVWRGVFDVKELLERGKRVRFLCDGTSY